MTGNFGVWIAFNQMMKGYDKRILFTKMCFNVIGRSLVCKSCEYSSAGHNVEVSK